MDACRDEEGTGPEGREAPSRKEALDGCKIGEDHQDCKPEVVKRNGELPRNEDITKRYAKEEAAAAQACREEPPNLGEAAGHCGQQ